ncbi:hypothetical protein SAMN04488061_3223 [Filomicrobium insigne]|uniref:Uncharacterized protein n=1 Tax=Filomicrobium insigne TaxID=418854 RepID=A0A1H0T9I8_9HYPH|nr:hypothetical protein [Filomicrobium insigne]SDP50684.1 hypothetical protein SAMN04488061_3223 [Filomicrobium insigne]
MTAAPTSNMDLSDVPRAASADLWLLIQIMVECEHGLLFLRGVTDVDRAKIEDRFWNDFEGGTERGVVALMRFWCLVDIFQSRRLRALLMARGYDIFYPAVVAAARLRLNLHWGFNPQRLIWALATERPAYSSALRLGIEASQMGMAA